MPVVERQAAGLQRAWKTTTSQRLLDKGLCVTVNSDDPAYFGGYVGENYVAAARALGLGRDDIVRLARNSFRASFLSPAEKQAWLDKVDRYAASHSA